MNDSYLPADKSGTLLQQAQYWLEKAVGFEKDNPKQAEMAFNMALKKERENRSGMDDEA